MQPVPTQQIQNQSRVITSPYAIPPFQANDFPDIICNKINNTLYHKDLSPSTYTSHTGYSFHENAAVPNTEPAVNVYEGASLKRAVPETEAEAEADDVDVVMDSSKRRRVDSGLGWPDEEYGMQREADGAAGEAVGDDGQGQSYWGGEGKACWGFGEQEQGRPGWKGKGKARAKDQEGAWV